MGSQRNEEDRRSLLEGLSTVRDTDEHSQWVAGRRDSNAISFNFLCKIQLGHLVHTAQNIYVTEFIHFRCYIHLGHLVRTAQTIYAI